MILTCPRCGDLADESRTGPGFPRPGAISRVDNLTVLCSACGHEEAVLVWTQGPRAIDPRTGVTPWVDPDAARRPSCPPPTR